MNNKKIIECCEALAGSAIACCPVIEDEEGKSEPVPMVANTVALTAIYIAAAVKAGDMEPPERAIARIIADAYKITREKITPNASDRAASLIAHKQ